MHPIDTIVELPQQISRLSRRRTIASGFCLAEGKRSYLAVVQTVCGRELVIRQAEKGGNVFFRREETPLVATSLIIGISA